MTTLTKVCSHCHTEKPVSEFYVRSGVETPTRTNDYQTKCKLCLKTYFPTRTALPPHIPGVISEIAAIHKLESMGIFAAPGKVVSQSHVDVVAWGCVKIEVKYSKLRPGKGFTFRTTPQQRKRGFLGHIVMLICEYPDSCRTFHLFESSHPVFYADGKVKAETTFIPGRTAPLKKGRAGIAMTEPIMREAQDKWEIVEQVRVSIGEALRTENSS